MSLSKDDQPETSLPVGFLRLPEAVHQEPLQLHPGSADDGETTVFANDAKRPAALHAKHDNTRRRLVNKSLSKEELPMVFIEQQMRAGLDLAAEHERRNSARDALPEHLRVLASVTNRFYWKSFSKRVLLFSIVDLRDRAHRQKQQSRTAHRHWMIVVGRAWRREQENIHTLQLQELIMPMLTEPPIWCSLQKRPESWPNRPNIRCPICISMWLATPSADRTRKKCNIEVWTSRQSQLFSLAAHVLQWHTDLGSHRLCGACGKMGASVRGTHQHFLIKHCGYDVTSALACSAMLAGHDNRRVTH